MIKRVSFGDSHEHGPGDIDELACPKCNDGYLHIGTVRHGISPAQFNNHFEYRNVVLNDEYHPEECDILISFYCEGCSTEAIRADGRNVLLETGPTEFAVYDKFLCIWERKGNTYMRWIFEK